MGVKSSLREAEHLLGGDNDFLPGSFNAVILCINSVGNVFTTTTKNEYLVGSKLFFNHFHKVLFSRNCTRNLWGNREGFSSFNCILI